MGHNILLGLLPFLSVLLSASVSGGAVGASSGLDCVQSCLTGMFDQITGSVEGAVQQALASPEFLTKFCSNVDTFYDCADTCGNFAGKEQILSQNEFLNYMCSENFDALISAMPCLEAVGGSESEKICSSKCGDAIQFAKSQNKRVQQFRRQTLSFMLKTVDVGCEFLQCHVECGRPMYAKHDCTAEGNLVSSIFRKQTATTIGQFESQGLVQDASRDLPHCYQFVNFSTLPFSHNNPLFLLALLVILMIH